ncbi:TrkH-domain-containing protein [Gyrodon lividus]|nr:TrkH-domain-containing protein [Gyrodon lividus]
MLEISHQSLGGGFWRTIRTNLNFFRVHLLFFTFTPLIFSGILYASNGRYPIAYIDALFNSVSAVTVCGLATVNLSQLTPWQQIVLFLQMCVGSPVVVAWFMVYTRRYFFAREFEHIIQAEAVRRAAPKVEAPVSPESVTSTGRRSLGWRVTSLFRRRSGLSPVAEEYASDGGTPTPREKEVSKKLRTDMIRRMDAPPKLVNPSGWISEGITIPLKRLSTKAGTGRGHVEAQSSDQIPSPSPHTSSPNLTSSPEGTAAQLPSEVVELVGSQMPPDGESRSQTSDPGTPGSTRSRPSGVPFLNSSTPHGGLQSSDQSVGMRRTATVDFAPIITRHHITLSSVPNRDRDDVREPSDGERRRRQVSRDGSYPRRRSSVGERSHASMTQNPTQHTHRSVQSAQPSDQMGQPQQKLSGFGGFPMPHEMLSMLFRRLFPRAANRLHRTVTIPATTALTGGDLGWTTSVHVHGAGSVTVPEGSKPVPYISFDAVVGRNSAFHMLTNEQLEELGGVEYRALNALLWLVALYHFGIQLISFIVTAPYMSLPKWANDFTPPALIRTVSPPWFSLFQVVSSYTNTGMSLVDQSMLPFQTAYPMIFFMMICILAGNTAFPIFLRFMIWTITKFVPADSRLHETLHFLLDHPRRCFVYLFPSHQTWFLLTILLVLNLTDFFCFMVLDIGNPVIDSIPFGTRFVAGLLQTIAVRASGFGIVPVASVAPAVKVMYVIMMYISVYPIALSVRSTNVYEEQSLGIFRNHDGLSDVERAFQPSGSRMTVWSRYLAMHARHQLSFDMWWLALALFLVCIIERDNLINTEIQGWFNIFSILFELVSAYGSVGLSLGIPNQNYSFSGAFRPLSKLIVCLVMIRGRHRGLPVAIDRAIMLPFEFQKAEDDLDPPPGANERRSSQYSTSNAPSAEDVFVDDGSHGQANAKKQEEVQDGLSGNTEVKRRSSSRRGGNQDVDVSVGASGWKAPIQDQLWT